MSKLTLKQLDQHDEFISRHIGPTSADVDVMIDEIKVGSLEELLDKTVPEKIRVREPLKLDEPCSEQEALETLKSIASKNKVNTSYIGMGYYDTLVPSVIKRNVLENPGWYSAYTPYQAEISQGRLEGLLNFQQMVMDLTAMDMANASLLDEATAAAEAMALSKRSNRLKTDKYFIDSGVFPQTIEVMKTRAKYFGFELIIGNAETELINHEVFGVLLQYPKTDGSIQNIEPIITLAHKQKALVSVATDLMSLIKLKPPGEMGADIVFGNSQRFGVPMGFGGPHAAFFAVIDKLKRSVPGRVIGVSIDSRGNNALRMAMQTREQHIRRDKATSNICTAQALLANMAGFYAVYHGASGLTTIADRIQRLSNIFALAVTKYESSLVKELVNTSWFDTLTLDVGDNQKAIYEEALKNDINIRLIDSDRLGVSFDEAKTINDLQKLLTLFIVDNEEISIFELDDEIVNNNSSAIPEIIRRESDFLTHEVFNKYHTETEMMRYLKRLENKDLSLVHAMIPLGSCTMKLNAASELMPLSWSEFSNIHPFAPEDQTVGYQEMIDQLSGWLAEVTGYAAVSLQPNSGAQGEYAGLVAINRYNKSIGEGHRDICLTPTSAHGTNPASAAMARMKIVLVDCDGNGNVDIDDLREKANQYRDNLACIMVTYPSTHGVFEDGIVEVCDIVHECGGQVYLDGANLNAQKGLAKPGLFGSDVSHLNLHKTFAIPHGGGGPGVGPIGVRSHLVPFLPGHINNDTENTSYAVSAAPFGSASILTISWMYMKMLGAKGNAEVSEIAILNANYIAKRLSNDYPILYKGENGFVAHECIIDIRQIKEASGISEEDIAKRLMDYGFHAPTMSFPVAGTLMIEPTESESKYELDRFCDAMIEIKSEINKVQNGDWPLDNNPLVNAPHTVADITADWNRPYEKNLAVMPKGVIATSKYWPSVNRVDNVHGDRNLICSCPSIESYR